MLALMDMGNIYYRPLVGNGMNRDTQIMTDVQSADEDSERHSLD